MNTEEWTKARREAVAFAMTEIEGGFAHALGLAGEVYGLGHNQLALVAQDMVMKIRPAVYVSQSKDGDVDVLTYPAIKGLEAHVDLLFIRWPDVTPDLNPEDIPAWLDLVEETVGDLALPSRIPLSSRISDLDMISECLENNEPEWAPDEEDPEWLDLRQRWIHTVAKVADTIELLRLDA